MALEFYIWRISNVERPVFEHLQEMRTNLTYGHELPSTVSRDFRDQGIMSYIKNQAKQIYKLKIYWWGVIKKYVNYNNHNILWDCQNKKAADKQWNK